MFIMKKRLEEKEKQLAEGKTLILNFKIKTTTIEAIRSCNLFKIICVKIKN